ncbi:MAG TPA: phosphopantetheine-binding protein, partial [Chloroflexota bacterium]
QEETAHVVVASIDWQRRLESSPALRASPVLSHLAQEWAAVADGAVPSSAGLRDAIAAAPLEGRNDAIEAYLRDQVAKVMGIAAAKVAPEKSLTSLGLDSLMAIEFRTRIRLDFDIDIPARAFLDGISIERLATMMLIQLSMRESDGAESQIREELEEITL